MKIGEARAIRDDIERARAKHTAEKEYQRDLRRIEAANRQRRKEHPHATHIERRAESDDEVRVNLSPDLVPLFERTEAFFAYVEDHPDEMAQALQSDADSSLRELEQRERDLARAQRTRARPKRYTPEQLSDVPF